MSEQNRNFTGIYVRGAVFLVCLALVVLLCVCGNKEGREYKAFVEQGQYLGGDKMVSVLGISDYSLKYVPESLKPTDASEIRAVLTYTPSYSDKYDLELYDMAAGVVADSWTVDDKDEITESAESRWNSYLYWSDFGDILAQGNYTPGNGIVICDPKTGVYSVNDVPLRYRPENLQDVFAILTVQRTGSDYRITFTLPSGETLITEDLTLDSEYVGYGGVSYSKLIPGYQSELNTAVKVLEYNDAMSAVLSEGFVPAEGAEKIVVYDTVQGCFVYTWAYGNLAKDSQSVRFILKIMDNNEIRLTDLSTGKTVEHWRCSGSLTNATMNECTEFVKEYLYSEKFEVLRDESYTASPETYGIVMTTSGEYVHYTGYTSSNKAESAENIRYVATLKNNHLDILDLCTGNEIYSGELDEEEDKDDQLDMIYYRIVATQMIDSKHSGTGCFLVVEKDDDGFYDIDSRYIPTEYRIKSVEDALNVGGIIKLKSSYTTKSAPYEVVGYVTIHFQTLKISITAVEKGKILFSKTLSVEAKMPDYVTSGGEWNEIVYSWDVCDAISEFWSGYTTEK